MSANNIGNSNNFNLTGNKLTSVTSNGKNYIQSNQQGSEKQKNQNISMSTTRLNGLDSTLLEESAHNGIEDEAFKSEYKIEKLENEIRLIDKQIKSAMSIGDQQKVDILNIKKHAIQKQLNDLNASYKNADVSRKLSSNIAYLIAPKKNVFQRFSESVSNVFNQQLMPRISRRFTSGQGLKVALNNLENINRSVDELVSNQAPYGEAEEKYDQLTKYLTKANTIQYNVSRELSKDGSRVSGNPFADQISKEKSDAKERLTNQANSKKDKAQKNALNLNNNLKK